MTEPPVVETIPALLAARRADAAGIQAIVADDVTRTYAELDDASATVAARLVAGGVVKGDRVGLLAPNTADWAVLAFGVMRILVKVAGMQREFQRRTENGHSIALGAALAGRTRVHRLP